VKSLKTMPGGELLFPEATLCRVVTPETPLEAKVLADLVDKAIAHWPRLTMDWERWIEEVELLNPSEDGLISGSLRLGWGDELEFGDTRPIHFHVLELEEPIEGESARHLGIVWLVGDRMGTAASPPRIEPGPPPELPDPFREEKFDIGRGAG
jgi:hypothetical protein